MKVLNKFAIQLTAMVLGVMLASVAFAQPANDLCTGAITVTCGQTVTGNTNTSTIDTPPACGLTFPRYGVWYRFVGTGQTVTASTCSATTNYDTQLGVFSGSCTALTCVAGNNDDLTCAANNRNSRVTFNTSPGVTYYIWVTGKLSSRGDFSLSITCTGGVSVPNDACANAILMNCNSTVTGSTTGATTDAVATCGTTLNTAAGVWYRFVGNGGSVTVSTCNPGTNYDTKLGVFSGACTALTCIGGNDDTVAPECVLPATGLNRKSRVTFQSVNGTTYYVLVTGFSTLTGNFELSVTCGAPPVPVDNNNCSDATPIACGGSASGTTATATSDGPAGGCATSTGGDRWYVVTGTGGTITANTCTGTTYDSQLHVYTGTCGALTQVTCNDDFCGLQSQVSWASVSGVQYRIRVHGFIAATGPFTLSVSCTTPLAEDNNLNPEELFTPDVNKLSVGQFFPNPAQYDNTNVQIFSPDETNARIVIYDNTGRAVYNRDAELNSGMNTIEIQVDDLSIGTYFAAIEVNGELVRRKLVVVR